MKRANKLNRQFVAFSKKGTKKKLLKRSCMLALPRFLASVSSAATTSTSRTSTTRHGDASRTGAPYSGSMCDAWHGGCCGAQLPRGAASPPNATPAYVWRQPERRHKKGAMSLRRWRSAESVAIALNDSFFFFFFFFLHGQFDPCSVRQNNARLHSLPYRKAFLFIFINDCAARATGSETCVVTAASPGVERRAARLLRTGSSLPCFLPLCVVH